MLYLAIAVLGFLCSVAHCGDVPYECMPNNHQLITNAFHHLNTKRTASELNRKSGWFRFKPPTTHGRKARLLEINEVKEIETDMLWSPCGSEAVSGFTDIIYNDGCVGRVLMVFFENLYVLSGAHPQVEDGQVRIQAQNFSYRHLDLKARNVPLPLRPIQCKIDFSSVSTVCTYQPFFGAKQEIMVRNCGEFFVYYLPQIKARFCIVENEKPKPKVREECQNYDTVIDTNRLWKSSPSQSDQSVPCKDIKFSMNWTRFYYQDSVFNQSAKLLDTCSVNSSLAGAYPCGGYYKGWLVKGHPVKEQVIVNREFCFSLPSNCKCQTSVKLQVINCGAYYIYKRSDIFPACGARACTVPHTKALKHPSTTTAPATTTVDPTTTVEKNSSQSTTENVFENATTTTIAVVTASTEAPPTTKTSPSTKASSTIATTERAAETTTIEATTTASTISDLCTNYETIIDDSRLWTASIDRLFQCDDKYLPAVRFISKNGQNLKMKENCTTDELDRSGFNCGSTGLTWLLGEHPLKESLLTPSYVCIQKRKSPTERNKMCSCDVKQLVWIKNCSSFFVYQFSPIVFENEYCPARYCMQWQENFLPSTTTSTVETTAALYSADGTLTLASPMLQGAPLTHDDLADKQSTQYMFLRETVHGFLQEAFSKITSNAVRIQIKELRIGSLIVDYSISSDVSLSTSALNTAFNAQIKNTSISKNGTLHFNGTVETSLIFVELCSQRPCHVNATCTNQPDKSTFTCECDTGYHGNGFACERDQKVVKEYEWSHDAIILVAVIGSLALLLILILSCCLCVKCCVEKSMKNSYDTTDRHQGYDNYITTKDMETNHNVKLQMYSFDSPPEAQRYDVLKAPKGNVTGDGKTSLYI